MLTAVLVTAPVVSAKPMGRVASTGPIAQSRLVGYSTPGVTSVPGVQETAAEPATSFVPPLHFRVTGLQIGHGWMSAESIAHVPPGQSGLPTQLRPTLFGSVVPAQRFGSAS